MEPKILAPEMKVRDADPSNNEALVELAALCPMEGDVSLCVERAPDFFALSRLEGDDRGAASSSPTRATRSRRSASPSGPCTCTARIGGHLHGRLEGPPGPPHQGVGQALVSFALDTVHDLLGPDGMILGTMLAGDRPSRRW